MARIIELPKLSPTMEEGTLVRWAKAEGDPIAVDDLLAEVETDKATMEFRSFDRGTLLKRLVSEGTVTKLGQPVAILGEPGEDITALLARIMGGGTAESAAPTSAVVAPALAPPLPAAAVAEAAVGRETVSARSTSQLPAEAAIRGTPGVAGVVLAPSSPRVRRIAREQAVDLEAIRGSGAHGRITEEDLAAPQAAATPSLPPALFPGDTVKAPSPMRKTIARRLVEAKQSVPHFYLEADLDVASLVVLREQVNEGASADDKVTFNDLLVRASALALRAVPECNVSWVDGQIVVHDRADISIAVALDDGLVTPVLRGADALSVRTIARTARALVARARARKLRPEEMQGGVFSVSNLGMFQVDRFAAVINPPESMILAVGATRDVAVVERGVVVPGKRCTVTLSCDHRVVDGAMGARFLQALRALVERPLSILA